MRHLLVLWSLVAVIFTACTTIKYVPVRETEYVHVRDSIYFVDTLVKVEVEKARISDFIDPGDTLVLQTPLARSTAYLDTLAGKLRGTLEQRGTVEGKVQWKERIIYRDSISTRDVPVPVEVEKEVRYTPWYMKALAFIGALGILAVAGWIAMKVWGPKF